MSASCQSATFATQQNSRYSITSSAVNNSLDGISTPKAFAVLELMASSNLVGCTTNGLSKALGQSVIVESKAGASGTTAAALVARAAPDGYTLMVIPSGHATTAATFAKLPYRSIDDFTMISIASDYQVRISLSSCSRSRQR